MTLERGLPWLSRLDSHHSLQPSTSPPPSTDSSTSKLIETPLTHQPSILLFSQISIIHNQAYQSIMSSDTAALTKVDSAVSGLSSSPPQNEIKGHRRASSSAAGVYNINDLGEFLNSTCLPVHHHRCGEGRGSSILADGRAEKEGKELEIAKETQKLNW